MTLSIMAKLSVIYGECRLCSALQICQYLLCVVMLNAIMHSIVMLNGIMFIVVMLNAVMFRVIMLNAIMLSIRVCYAECHYA